MCFLFTVLKYNLLIINKNMFNGAFLSNIVAWFHVHMYIFNIFLSCTLELTIIIMLQGGMHYGATSNAAPYKNHLGNGVQPNQQSNRNQFSSTRCQPQQQQQAKTHQEQYQLPKHAVPYRGFLLILC